MRNFNHHFWYVAVIIMSLAVILFELLRTKITWLAIPEAIFMVAVTISTVMYWHCRRRERRLK